MSSLSCTQDPLQGAPARPPLNAVDSLPSVMWDGLATRLEGEIVVLEPLQAHHEEGLWAACQDPRTRTWTILRGKSPRHFQAWFETTLAASEAGEECAFVTLDRATGRVIGGTGYHPLRDAPRGPRIGGTWLPPTPGG